MASVMEDFTNNSINLESLPQHENVDFQAVSGKYLIKANAQTGIFLIVVMVGWIAMAYYEVSRYNLVLAMGAIVLFFAFRFWNNYKLQKNYGYALREKDILYRRGFFVTSTTIVPFNRIQHVSISRDLFDKLLDIASVQVFTAGGSGSDISIPGLQPQRALQLKEALAVKLTEDEK